MFLLHAIMRDAKYLENHSLLLCFIKTQTHYFKQHPQKYGKFPGWVRAHSYIYKSIIICILYIFHIFGGNRTQTHSALKYHCHPTPLNPRKNIIIYIFRLCTLVALPHAESLLLHIAHQRNSPDRRRRAAPFIHKIAIKISPKIFIACTFRTLDLPLRENGTVVVVRHTLFNTREQSSNPFKVE